MTTPKKLGRKWECSECGVKFYDLGKTDVACPRCGTELSDEARKEAGEEPVARRSTAPRTKGAGAPAPDSDAEDEDVDAGEVANLDEEDEGEDENEVGGDGELADDAVDEDLDEDEAEEDDDEDAAEDDD